MLPSYRDISDQLTDAEKAKKNYDKSFLLQYQNNDYISRKTAD